MLEILKMIAERKAIMSKVTCFLIYMSCHIGLSTDELALKLWTSLACSEDLGNEICNPRRLGVQKNVPKMQPSVLNLHMTSFPIWFWRGPCYAENINTASFTQLLQQEGTRQGLATTFVSRLMHKGAST